MQIVDVNKDYKLILFVLLFCFSVILQQYTKPRLEGKK